MQYDMFMIYSHFLLRKTIVKYFLLNNLICVVIITFNLII